MNNIRRSRGFTAILAQSTNIKPTYLLYFARLPLKLRRDIIIIFKYPW